MSKLQGLHRSVGLASPYRAMQAELRSQELQELHEWIGGSLLMRTSPPGL